MSELFADPRVAAMLVIGVAVGVAVVVGNLFAPILERVTMRAKLREIDDLYDLVDLRDQELLLPFVDRVVAPFRNTLIRVARRFSPEDYAGRIRTLMARAGRRNPVAADRFMAVRVLGILGAPVVFFGCYKFAPVGGMLRLALGGIAAVALATLPSTRLKRTVEDREGRIRRELPDMLDLLVVCVEAGLGFTAALSRTVTSVPGELSGEFAIALGEMRAGVGRTEALERLVERVQIAEVRSFVSALRQAEQFGAPIAAVLRNQAEDIRIRRQQLAQEKAQKAPVKMLVPMVFCIFPPLFIIVIGPAGIQLTQGGF